MKSLTSGPCFVLLLAGALLSPSALASASGKLEPNSSSSPGLKETAFNRGDSRDERVPHNPLVPGSNPGGPTTGFL
jgi:hypothetical protein